MAKNLNIKQWIRVINKYETKGINEALILYCKFNPRNRKYKYWKSDLRKMIKKKSKIVDNLGMNSLNRKSGSGRSKKPQKPNFEEIYEKLNDLQKKEIIEDWFEEQSKKKKNERIKKGKTLKSLSPTLISFLFHIDRTSLYKKVKQRTYKWDYIKQKVLMIWGESKYIYGSRKIAIMLSRKGIWINDRTLRNYMKRWNFIVETRKAKRKAESKNIAVKYKDLVKRNFNPIEDNIIATDVSYIPAKVSENNIYLSVAINHKTKAIESYKIKTSNDSILVTETIKSLKRKNFILHSDHGTQYSSHEVQELLLTLNSKTSMGRVGNSLDNREVEYFFGCLKGEYLNRFNTHNMKINEIKKHIDWYISWYNTKRIQKRLQWQAPSSVSQYAI